MNRNTLLLWIMLFCPLFVFAQNTIQSSVFDAGTNKSIEGANVRLTRASDNSFVQAVQTSSDGTFKLERVQNGKYTLSISFLGYYEKSQSVTVNDKPLTLERIKLEENTTVLAEVEVKGTAAQMVVKGDTIEFNATAFKTGENAVVEDLLKRLPGVEITSEGKITVNGEEVTKIRVDGKKFFEGDNEMATKNIPADLIDKVQVLEQKSEMSQLTGFDDGDSERIINLTFKPNRKHGKFGNITAGAGMDVDNNIRYNGNGFLNLVDGDMQTTFTGGANNTNTPRSTRGRGGFNSNNGISEVQDFGINNNTIINPSLTIGGDGTFNHTKNNTETRSIRQTYIGDQIYNDSTNNSSINNFYSVNARFESEWKIDTLTTIIFQPNLNYNRTYNNSRSDYLYRVGADTTSFGDTQNNGIGSNLGGGLRTMFNRKSGIRRGRTFTAQVDFNLSQSDNESVNISNKFGTSPEAIDQQTFQNSDRYSVSLRMSYVEPLWNVKNLLEIVGSVSGTFSSSQKNQYEKDMSTGAYTVFDSVYSSNYRTSFYRESFELNYKYTEKSYNLTIGMKVEPSQTNSFGTREISTSVVNFSPSARFQYNFGKKKFVRIFYNGRTSEPNINQMQPVKNNSNLMSETIGNPSLKPSFNHSVRAMFSSFNDKYFSSVSGGLWFNVTKDAFVNNSIYDQTGKRFSQTVNSGSMPINGGGNFMYNTPLFNKLLQFNTNTFGSYNKRYGYVSRGMTNIVSDSLPLGALSETQTLSISEQISLTYANDVVEAGLKGGVRYSGTQNNMNTSNTNIFDWNGTLNLVFNLPYNFTISSDISYITRQGYENFDQNEIMWNASIDKSFLNKKAVISLKAFDILQQQLNIRQSVGDNYIQNSSYNTLRSYVMLSFTYKISQFSGMKESDVDQRPFGGGPGSPGGPGGRGGRPMF